MSISANLSAKLFFTFSILAFARGAISTNNLDKILGDGIKQIWDSEKPAMKKLRENLI